MKKLFKASLIVISYGIPTILVGEFLLGIKYRESNEFYKFLNDISYTDATTDPYKAYTKQNINPHFMFWFPLDPAKRNELNNKHVSLTRNGYRRTIPQSRNEQKSRECLLVLGGSTAFGHGSSNDENTISSNLQKKFGSNKLVFNLGVPSWNSYQELLSVQRFVSRDIFQTCSKLDTVSITSSNDIYVTTEYLGSKYDSYLEYLVSAPESFASLESRVDDIRSQMSLVGSLESLGSASMQTFLGNTKRALSSLRSKIKNHQSMTFLQSLKTTHTKLSNNEVSFVNNQAKSFWKNHATISYIVANAVPNSIGRHHVVLQPNLLNIEITEKEAIWSFANIAIDKSRPRTTKLSNLCVFDARKLWISDPLQKTSLRKIFMSKNQRLSDVASLKFFDNVHLTDSGVRDFSQEIYTRLLSPKCDSVYKSAF